MDNSQVIRRIEELLQEKHITWNTLKENTSISTTVYQWKKNGNREATRTPSLKSIEKICSFFDISLSYFFAPTKERRLDVKQQELFDKIQLLNEEDIDAVGAVVNALLRNSVK